MSGYATDVRVAVKLGPLAIALATLLGFAAAYGICSISLYFLRGIFSFVDHGVLGIVGKIPGVGGWVDSKVEAAEQRLTHWIGQAAAGSEARMADAFHSSADLTHSIGHEIMGQAIATWQLTHWVANLAWSIANGEAWQEIFHNTITTTKAQVKQLQRTERAHAKRIAHTADAHALPSLREQARARENALARDHAGTRARTREAENGIEALWAKVRHLDKITTGVLASALVATALGRLGSGWIRCSNVGRLGRRLCGIDTRLLEALLGAATISFVVSDLCEFTHLLSQAAQKVEPLLLDFVKTEDALINCRGATKPPNLPLRASRLPPLQTAAALPSL